MCGSMADIQSLTAQIRRGNKKRRKRRNSMKIYMVSLLHRATITSVHERACWVETRLQPRTEGSCCHWDTLAARRRGHRCWSLSVDTSTATSHRLSRSQPASNNASTTVRGVATAGDTGDASPVRPTMSPYIKMTTDSLSSELTFDEWRGVILQRITRPTLLLHVINHYTTCCF